jgi:hypothetical protein
VMPLEVEIPSLRVLVDSELEEVEWVKVRYEKLNLISEKRISLQSAIINYTKEEWPNHMIRRFDFEDSTKEILYWRKYCLYQEKIKVNGHRTMRALTWWRKHSREELCCYLEWMEKT